MGNMDATLLVVGGKTSKKQVALKLPTVIGRSRSAGLTIAHPMISRKHCELFANDGALMVRDLDSLNGTLVGGRRVKKAALPPDAEFTVGPITFRVQYEYSGDPAKLPPPVLDDRPAPKPAENGNASAASDDGLTSDPAAMAMAEVEMELAADAPQTISEKPQTAKSKPAKPDDDDFDVEEFFEEVK
jgi:predicted component of type VI protein secretion system